MNQTSYVFGVAFVAFVFWVTIKGDLPKWFALFAAAPATPFPSASGGSAASAPPTAAAAPVTSPAGTAAAAPSAASWFQTAADIWRYVGGK